MVGAFILGWIGGAVVTVAILWLCSNRVARVTPEGIKIGRVLALDKGKPFAFWKKEPEPEPRKPLGSIPRTVGPWRRQRLDWQKQHNSKQKERDALINRTGSRSLVKAR
jgi:hypothetical protein